jgi:hypothetical protein
MLATARFMDFLYEWISQHHSFAVSDLSRATIDRWFDAGDEAAFAGGEE